MARCIATIARYVLIEALHYIREFRANNAG